ncbi:MAG: undecaprenyldiphospho-muramoylpentapeptide beta-N-acetylglucosaminyltransferase [Arenicella sp.]
MKCLLIMAGGTGGHVFPALAVANCLKEQDVKIVWLGTQKGIESRLVPEAGYEIEWITVQGLRGNGWRRWLVAPFTLTRALWQALMVMRRVKPDCVLGMGGFASGPGGLAAYLLRKPLLIHEQNAVAGMTNQWLARFAKSILTGFRQTEGLPKDAVWVGNPVRRAISREIDPENIQTYTSKRILVLGGSQGARSLNKGIPKVLRALAKKMTLEVVHQAGKDNAAEVQKRYDRSEDFLSAKATGFINDMAKAYHWADIVICRAGAMTVTEIMAAGKPAVFVPYPFAAGDHQTKNAQAMLDANAAIMVTDEQITDKEFVQQLAKLLRDPKLIVSMGLNAQRLYRPSATQQVAEYCRENMHA